MTEIEYEDLPKEATLPIQLMAGALAGITEHAVMHPFDSIKVKKKLKF